MILLSAQSFVNITGEPLLISYATCNQSPVLAFKQFFYYILQVQNELFVEHETSYPYQAPANDCSAN